MNYLPLIRTNKKWCIRLAWATFFLSSNSSFGQLPTLDYFNSLNNDSAIVNSMIYSSDGNLIIAGEFSSDKFKYGSNNLVNIDQGTTTRNYSDFFIAKLNAQNGSFLWATGGGAKNLYPKPYPSLKNESISKVCQDATGNLYAIGTHEGEIEFQGDIIGHNNNDDKDIFIIKLSSIGKRIWTISIESPVETGWQEFVADAFCNKNGDLILGVNNLGSRAFNLYKISSDGDLITEASISGCQSSRLECVSLSPSSNGDIIVGTVSLCPKIRVNDSIITPTAPSGIYRFSSDLKLKWVKFTSGGLNSIRTNSENKIWLSYIQQTNNLPVQAFSLIDSAGNTLYTKELTNTGTSVVDIIVDSKGNLFTSGTFLSPPNNSSTPLKFDNFTINHNNSNEGSNSYLTRFNIETKTFDWVISIDGHSHKINSFCTDRTFSTLYTSINNVWFYNAQNPTANVFYNQTKTNYQMIGLYIGKINLQSTDIPDIEISNIQEGFYPNPCREFLKTSHQVYPNTTLEIYNLNGLLLNSVIGKNEIETNNLLPGLYCVKLSNPNKTIKSFFIKG
jgi:hypothetical protein